MLKFSLEVHCIKPSKICSKNRYSYSISKYLIIDMVNFKKNFFV
ncbi:unnamed protein product [Moneuplotes crassus]|uniref:Uncharacterized protein n=1 Tax=Euplotes crassus TaxID=5936 RepID=A0AAD1UDP1_EUPCR|nr:unnamed protein product [Moneuplotes crassus]